MDRRTEEERKGKKKSDSESEESVKKKRERDAIEAGESKRRGFSGGGEGACVEWCDGDGREDESSTSPSEYPTTRERGQIRLRTTSSAVRSLTCLRLGVT